MWTTEPTPEDVAKWFSGCKLHGNLDHKRYISGIIAIDNPVKNGGKVWKPYVTAATRIAYFHDYADEFKLNSTITRILLDQMAFDLPEDKKARVIVCEMLAELRDSQGVVTRSAIGTKQVSSTMAQWHPTERGVKVILPDPAAIMKAETGAVARALGNLGMLTFPESGIATAEDMVDLRSELAQQDSEKETEPKVNRRANDPRAS